MKPTTDSSSLQFDFGQNWKEFSQTALTPERVRQAREHFTVLLEGVNLEGRSFLDIGFGQGLSLLTAAAMGTRASGCDINPKCAEVLESNRRHFPELAGREIPVVVGSILDRRVVERVREMAPERGGFDIVHSWGVLHHTGNMDVAIRHAASLVRLGGHFVLAIYNRHWSSLPWKAIKWLYVHVPRPVQRAMIAAFYPIIFLAKWLVTREDPRRQTRGMDFYYNVVDWVGGHPYEYASCNEMRRFMEGEGFTLVREIPAEVPTGCNEFVFRRKPSPGAPERTAAVEGRPGQET